MARKWGFGASYFFAFFFPFFQGGGGAFPLFSYSGPEARNLFCSRPKGGSILVSSLHVLLPPLSQCSGLLLSSLPFQPKKRGTRRPPRVPGKLGVPPGVLLGAPFLVLSRGKALLGGHSRGHSPEHFLGIPEKTPRKHSPEHFRGCPKKHSCKWPAGSQNKGGECKRSLDA